MAQNTRWVEISLFLFSTLVVVITILNIVEYANILSGPDNEYFTSTQARTYLILNSILLIVAAGYWFYRVWKLIFTQEARQLIVQKVESFGTKDYKGLVSENTLPKKNIFKNIFSKKKEDCGLPAVNGHTFNAAISMDFNLKPASPRNRIGY